MKPISHRALGFPASPIRKLMPQATAAKARGLVVHHVNIGQPDIPTPDTVLQAIRSYEPQTIAYAQSGGNPAYVDGIHRYYRSIGHDLRPGQVMATTGGSEAIIFAFLTAMDPGDEILVPEPFYTNYNTMAQVAGLTIRPITTTGEDGFHLPSRETLEAAITPQTKAILICNPSNPTGTVYTRSEIDTLADLAKAHDLWLISDEVYREFVFEPRADDYRSILEREDLAERTIVVDSVSKRFSMCGARLGALVTRNDDIAAAALRLGQARLSSSSLAQHVARDAHDLPSEYYASMIDEYRRRRDVVFEALSAISGVSLVRPEGAFYTIPHLPVDDAERFARWLLTDFQVEGETVMVAPAAGFYMTEGLGRQEIRIAFVLDVDRLRRSMGILRRALDVYPGAG